MYPIAKGFDNVNKHISVKLPSNKDIFGRIGERSVSGPYSDEIQQADFDRSKISQLSKSQSSEVEYWEMLEARKNVEQSKELESKEPESEVQSE